MTQQQMTPKQLQDLNTFNRMLEQSQWMDPFATQALLKAGKEVSPEGTQEFFSADTHFQAQIHLPVQMITLKIIDIAAGINRKIHFLYEEKPDEFLVWMCKVSPRMSIEEYPLCIKQTFGYKGMVLLELKDGGLLDLNPSIQQVPLQEAALCVSV